MERVLECTPEQCRCGQCGKDKKLIGWDVTETLDLKPLEFFVIETKRAKYACPVCPDEGVQQPPVPVRIIERGMCEDRVVIEVLVRKYTDHLPLYRQAAAFLRDADIASVIEKTKRLGINPRDYLADVLPRLASGMIDEVPSFTPAAWLRARLGKPAAYAA